MHHAHVCSHMDRRNDRATFRDILRRVRKLASRSMFSVTNVGTSSQKGDEGELSRTVGTALGEATLS